tara:strand:- start:74 stop:583 length:510 start_codon:yes stop_codon:yes gene_type:complete
MKYPMSDFTAGHLVDTPGKKAYFNFMAKQGGGWDMTMERHDRGCNPATIRGQHEYFMSIVDQEDLKKYALEEYDLPKNAEKRHLPLEEKMFKVVKNKTGCLASQFRGKIPQIHSLCTDQPQPITSFISEETPKVKKESSIDKIQNVLKMCKNLTDGEKKVIIQSLQLSF